MSIWKANLHPEFKLNAVSYTFEGLNEKATTLISIGKDFEKEIGMFLLDWLCDKQFVTVQTSGSTGKPKTIQLSKQAMVNSALATGAYFNLKPKNRALLCLPVAYIAGKMMLVRAMVLGLHLNYIQPKLSLPKTIYKAYDFCAMTPAQAENSLLHLNTFKKIIVGGAAVSLSLKNKLQCVHARIYETYGMTETITHVAVKRLNYFAEKQDTNTFLALPNVTFTITKDSCLIIDAPQVSKTKIVTNDVVQLLDSKSFIWLGRKDFVINSGGVKLHPEQIEKKLAKFISNRFFITKEKDAILGEIVVLVIESTKASVAVSKFISSNKFEKPKKVYYVSNFIETATGKIDRLKTHQVAKSNSI